MSCMIASSRYDCGRRRRRVSQFRPVAAFAVRRRVLVSAPLMTQNPHLIEWSPVSWCCKPAQQQPVYYDQAALEAAVAALSRFPPLVLSWEIEALSADFVAALRG